MAYVWCAFAGGEGTTEENLIGIYTSRTKARRAVLAYWQLDRGRWDDDMLDNEWLIERVDDSNAYGYASRRLVQ